MLAKHITCSQVSLKAAGSQGRVERGKSGEGGHEVQYPTPNIGRDTWCGTTAFRTVTVIVVKAPHLQLASEPYTMVHT